MLLEESDDYVFMGYMWIGTERLVQTEKGTMVRSPHTISQLAEADYTLTGSKFDGLYGLLSLPWYWGDTIWEGGGN